MSNELGALFGVQFLTNKNIIAWHGAFVAKLSADWLLTP